RRRDADPRQRRQACRSSRRQTTRPARNRQWPVRRERHAHGTVTDSPAVASNASNPIEIEVRVRYAETDQMGVVYHANYFVWCEIARTELSRRRFVPYSELEKRGVLLAVAEASMRYHAPARYDDDVRVRTWISEVRSRIVTFD